MICDWTDKSNFFAHYTNLKFWFEMGLKNEKINNFMRFKQKRWQKPYTDLNTQLRSNFGNNFRKTFWKIMNNFLSGKFVEYVRQMKEW